MLENAKCQNHKKSRLATCFHDIKEQRATGRLVTWYLIFSWLFQAWPWMECFRESFFRNNSHREYGALAGLIAANLPMEHIWLLRVINGTKHFRQTAKVRLVDERRKKCFEPWQDYRIIAWGRLVTIVSLRWFKKAKIGKEKSLSTKKIYV